MRYRRAALGIVLLLVLAAVPAAAAGSWSSEGVRGIAGTVSMLGVSCPSATHCVAAGSADHVLAVDVGSGHSWRVQPVAQPARDKGGALSAVSCSSVRGCTAVGYYRDHLGQDYGVVERWNGSAWNIQLTRAPFDSKAAGLSGVSCPTATMCMAVGGYNTLIKTENLLIEWWTGDDWTIQSPPSPSAVPDTNLDAVSCSSPVACTAVGTAGNGSGKTTGLIERWDGTTWSLQTSAPPPGATAVELFGVSCPSADDCTAVGLYQDGDTPFRNLAEQWNGTSWHLQSVPDPAGSTGLTELHGVSCSAPDACTAVGLYEPPSHPYRTLAVSWNGSAWSTQPTPTPTVPSALLLLDAVSCPGPVCTAVGFSDDIGGKSQAIVEVG